MGILLSVTLNGEVGWRTSQELVRGEVSEGSKAWLDPTAWLRAGGDTGEETYMK